MCRVSLWPDWRTSLEKEVGAPRVRTQPGGTPALQNWQMWVAIPQETFPLSSGQLGMTSWLNSNQGDSANNIWQVWSPLMRDNYCAPLSSLLFCPSLGLWTGRWTQEDDHQSLGGWWQRGKPEGLDSWGLWTCHDGPAPLAPPRQEEDIF